MIDDDRLRALPRDVPNYHERQAALVGNATERIKHFGHDRLKTFGVGTELDGRGWLSVIRQLLAQGHLLPDPDGHGGLVLAPSAGEVLRGTHELRFRTDAPRERSSGPQACRRGNGRFGI